jgi:flagella basal body P-ring formation protein FlgA
MVTHLLLRSAFVLTVIVGSILPLAAQQSAPRAVLRADVAVNRETVTIGDLLEVSGPIADTPVFRAPALGRSGTIQVSRVVEAARGLGLEPVNRAGAAQVTVTRQARRISKTEIEEIVRRGLGSRFGMDQAEVSISLENGENALFVEPEATGDLKIVDLFHDAKARRVEAVLTIPASRSLTSRPLRVAGAVVDMVDVPVLVRAVARGEAIRPVDLRTERKARAELPAGAVTDVATLTGKVTRSALVAGAMMRDGDLVKQDIVEKNSIVTVVYEGPGLSLSMRGKAMEAGGMGDAILIQNIQSKRSVQGTVVGPGKVSVNFGVPGPVAAVQSTLE